MISSRDGNRCQVPQIPQDKGPQAGLSLEKLQTDLRVPTTRISGWSGRRASRPRHRRAPAAQAFQRHGVARPARNPRGGPPAGHGCGQPHRRSTGPDPLDAVLWGLNPGALPDRERSPAELHEWLRCEKQHAIFGADLVVELYSQNPSRG